MNSYVKAFILYAIERQNRKNDANIDQKLKFLAFNLVLPVGKESQIKVELHVDNVNEPMVVYPVR